MMIPLHWAWAVFVLFLAVVASLHILFNKREPPSATLWLVLVWSLPLLGFLLYWTLGVNRVARKAKRRLRRAALALTRPDKGNPPASPSGLLPLRRLADHVARQPLQGGNHISPLESGNQAYPAMLEAMDRARHSLAMCSYIFDTDEVGHQFLKALVEAARRGVRVRLLVDGMGAWGLGPRVKRLLTRSGGQMASFWPRGRWLRHPGINLRNHRKILVVDGSLGFTGGMNISRRHLDLEGRQAKSRDIHFSVEGPAVRHMMDTFVQDWELSTGERLEGPDWFPALKSAGSVAARGLASGPDQDYEKIYELILGALRSARRRVDLMTPYFIPDRAILSAMRAAARSGVKVRLAVPHATDYLYLGWASRGYWWELVGCGVELWQVNGEFIHSKLVVVDGQWVLLGSASLDPRSFWINFEFNLETYSKSLAAKVLDYMDRQLEHAHRVDHAHLARIHFLPRLRDQAAKLFSPYL